MSSNSLGSNTHGRVKNVASKLSGFKGVISITIFANLRLIELYMQSFFRKYVSFSNKKDTDFKIWSAL